MWQLENEINYPGQNNLNNDIDTLRHKRSDDADSTDADSNDSDEENEDRSDGMHESSSDSKRKFSNALVGMRYLESASTNQSVDSSTPTSFNVVVVGENFSQKKLRNISKLSVHNVRPMFLMNKPMSYSEDVIESVESDKTLSDYQSISKDSSSNYPSVEILPEWDKIDAIKNLIINENIDALLKFDFMPFSLLWSLKNRQKRRKYRQQISMNFLVFPTCECRYSRWHKRKNSCRHHYYKYPSVTFKSHKA